MGSHAWDGNSMMAQLLPPDGADFGSGSGAVALEPDDSRCYRSRCPNFLLVLSDDHGFTDLGNSVDANVNTPILDRLLQKGARFKNGYASASQCVPSRAGLLSGRNQNL